MPPPPRDPGASPDTPERDIFAEIIAQLDPARILHDPRATGEGVTVAVIDSGIEQATLVEKYQQRGIAIQPIEGGIFRPGRAEPEPYDGRQSTPHGTTVADIILASAPRVRLYSADVFGPQGTCEVEVIINALRWAVDVWKCKVINLSLGVPESRLQPLARRHQLLRAVEDGYYKDALIVAAAHNEHPLTRSYPAAFAPPLLSVDKALFDDPLRAAYAPRDHIEFLAHARGYLGPFAQEPATSWAAPHLSAIAARLLSLRPTLKPFELKTILYWMFGAGGGQPTQS